jgi:hypothetical protein
MKKLTAIILIALISCVSSYAQDTIPSQTSINGGFGTVTMNGVQWQRFSIRPDIPIGNAGIGLDLELFIDNEGKVSDEGWDFSNKNKVWDSVLRKIYYVRYNKPLDKLYLRAGALDDVTLGYGLIMNGYTNTLTYPADKKLGVHFALRDVGTFGLGLEIMANSIGDLKNNGILAGGRISARPFKPADMGLFSKLTVGLTAVRDVNQYAGLTDSDNDGIPDFQDGFINDKKRWADSDGDGFEDDIDIDADGDNILDTLDSDITTKDYINIKERANGVSVSGLDIGLPILEGWLNIDIYGQAAKIFTGNDQYKGGWGIGAPGIMVRTERLKGQLEYRHFNGRFRSGYFDNLYEHERVMLSGNALITKDMMLPDNNLDGVYGSLGYKFFNLVSTEAGYQYMTGDKDYQDLTGTVRLLDGALKNIPKITLLEGYFYNRYVETGKYDVFDLTTTTLYGTRVGFSLSGNISVVWNTKYTFSPKPDGRGLERNRFVSIETVLAMK